MSQTQLKIAGLRKQYDNEIVVLKDIDLDIKEKEFLVLVGPSGCGKSTLLRSIAGLETVSSGKIFIADKDVTNLSPADRNIAMVFQDYALYPHMTVRGNLGFGLKMRKEPKERIEKQIQRAAKILDIDHLLDRKPAQLSGGQRQRVAIGRAIVRNADLFLFDEPLSNLDAKLRAQTRIELADLHHKIGATSVYVTHDQVEAMTLADRIVVLNQGIVQQIGSPMELYSKPANRFVASFIGSPTMNFLEGKLELTADKKIFTCGEATLDLSDAQTPSQAGSYVLGIRPESFKVIPEGGKTDESVDCQLESIFHEPHGHEAHMVAKLGGHQVIVRSANPGRLARILGAKRGELLPTHIEKHALHWFEADKDGKRVATN
jgi:ABC-type sugar transport system ATPase subunit